MTKTSRIIRRESMPSDPVNEEQAKIQSNAEIWIPEDKKIPTVEYGTSNGVVETITVRCACGCVTELVCEYE